MQARIFITCFVTLPYTGTDRTHKQYLPRHLWSTAAVLVRSTLSPRMKKSIGTNEIMREENHRAFSISSIILGIQAPLSYFLVSTVFRLFYILWFSLLEVTKKSTNPLQKRDKLSVGVNLSSFLHCYQVIYNNLSSVESTFDCLKRGCVSFSFSYQKRVHHHHHHIIKLMMNFLSKQHHDYHQRMVLWGILMTIATTTTTTTTTSTAAAFTTTTTIPFTKSFGTTRRPPPPTTLVVLRQQPKPSEWQDNDNDANKWRSMDDPDLSNPDTVADDWQKMLQQKQDGSFWSSFESEEEEEEDVSSSLSLDENAHDNDDNNNNNNEEVDAEAWLDTLAALGAEEIEFNLKEADRADKARQMEEWGFDKETISNTLEIAVDETLETADEVMVQFQQDAYLEEDDIDYTTVESHTQVELDPDTGEPIRTQMVYVDEHTCIGCTHCAMIAQSTFFMEEDYGRARVFNQWGDDDETIQIAIETCPVDCIHYVPFDELKRLEEGRRGQTINFKARLVNQGEYTAGASHMTGAANAFSAPQQISGNMGSRCNNCPSRGCKNCPMYGVGKNPEFEKRERDRKAKAERRRLEKERASQNKSADL